ncbi:hypothetical protein ES703_108148 [subsurface metagenome]
MMVWMKISVTIKGKFGKFPKQSLVFVEVLLTFMEIDFQLLVYFFIEVFEKSLAGYTNIVIYLLGKFSL